MKKGLLAVLVVALIAVAVTGAFAFGPGYGQGPGACAITADNATPAQAQKFAKFQSEILPLKQKMLQLRTDLMTLRAQTPTDWNAISAKQKEMVDVRTEIQKKAADSGFSGAGAGSCGCGMGRTGMHRMGQF